MRFRGHLYKEGSYWLAEVPAFEAMTQARTHREALRMVADWFQTFVNKRGFTATAHPVSESEFELEGSDLGVMIGLLLKRQRHRSGLTLAEVSDRLRARSRNAYARYEQGVCVPTVEKLDELLRAVSPGRDFVLGESRSSLSEIGDPNRSGHRKTHRINRDWEPVDAEV